MPNAAPSSSENAPWLPVALILCAIAIALRLTALVFDQTDLFVDETQYWFWGQNFDFGYYSKPPFVGWLIRGVTDLVGSDAAFWVRMPGSILHAITALLLGALAARLFEHRAALWTVALYLTLPFTGLGSIMISTDTVMAPFYAAALLFFVRAAQNGRATDALLTGLFAGGAFMSKYAVVYFLSGAALVIVFVPGFRPSLRNLALMALGFGAAISPNVIWNITHDLTTVSHTMDNVGWVRDGARIDVSSMAEFLASQFGVFGPVTMAALLLAYTRARTDAVKALVLFSIPALIVVSAQALLDKAYANWAIAAYFSGTVLVAHMMTQTWRWIALGTNMILTASLPLLIVLAPWPMKGESALLSRYLGRHALSESALAVATQMQLPLVSNNRDVLADLFYTGRDAGVEIYAVPEPGRPSSYYAQNFALPDGMSGEVLVIWTGKSVPCAAEEVAGLAVAGVWTGKKIALWKTDAACFSTP